MSQIKKNEVLMSIKVILLVSIIIFFILEALSSMAYYQQKRASVQSLSSTVASIQWLIPKLRASGDDPKFNRLINLRQDGTDAYPSYVFDPRRHDPDEFYHLANVPRSYIVYCEEVGPSADWNSDELGFRNPVGQLESNIDFIFIGDSFTEGACESEGSTFAGLFRERGEKVFNLGRGGAGPLFNLATLVEYGDAVKANTVLWFVFTGNDMQNLRDEKTTKLSNYLTPGYSQNLLSHSTTVSKDLKRLLNLEIFLKQSRVSEGLKPPYMAGNRNDIDLLEATYKEGPLLLEVAMQIKEVTNANGAKLAIVLINHPRYTNSEIQTVTLETIRQFSIENNVPYLNFSTDFLSNSWNELYNEADPHFNANGYRRIGAYVHSWINSENLESKVVMEKTIAD